VTFPPKLAKLNDQLKVVGGYGDASIASEARRAQAEAWLKLRSAIDHGETKATAGPRQPDARE
jgi:hypothetical protein